MKETEKKAKINEYLRKAHGLLGHHMTEFECEFMGDHPIVEVEYFDYKVSIITRAELQQLMPEVELAKVKRTISDSALMIWLVEVMWGPDTNGDMAFVRRHDTGEEITLGAWAESELFNRDLSTTEIPYNKNELKDEWITDTDEGEK